LENRTLLKEFASADLSVSAVFLKQLKNMKQDQESPYKGCYLNASKIDWFWKSATSTGPWARTLTVFLLKTTCMLP
jgi:hypothetical protein